MNAGDAVDCFCGEAQRIGVLAGAGIARASETPTAVSRTRPFIARICRPRRQAGRAQQARFDHRTKAEHPATILLPNPVAADDMERHATDGPVKIRRQINTRWGGGSRVAIAITEFRVRYFIASSLTGLPYPKLNRRTAASTTSPDTSVRHSRRCSIDRVVPACRTLQSVPSPSVISITG